MRIDRHLVDLGLAPSRERARAILMTGDVLVDDAPVTKAGALVDDGATVRVRGRDHPFVSRGGVKLDGALEDLGVSVEGAIVLDVGASTGGFTDCCLRRGAAAVYAVDVGRGQMAHRIAKDPRVTLLEGINARSLEPEMLPGPADLAAIDVSFISIAKIFEAVAACLAPGGEILAMVKPQFEVGRGRVGKGGVVRDEADRRSAVEGVVEFARARGFAPLGAADARIRGPKGNRETFVLLARPEAGG